MQHIDNHFGKSSDPDMERSQQLLAVSIALVTIIKNNMPYSANMDAVFSEKCNNENDKDYNEFYSILERDTKTVKSAAFSDQAQNALELGTGNCAELASCLMLLASMLDAHSLALRGDKSVYITMILIRDTSMDCHAFCLLHSSEVLAKKECFDGIASNLADLSNRTDLKDAIILDPWLNFVGTLEKVQYYVDHSKLYHAEEYLIGGIQVGLTHNDLVLNSNLLNSVDSEAPKTEEQKVIKSQFHNIYSQLIANPMSLDKGYQKTPDQIKQSLAQSIDLYRFNLLDDYNESGWVRCVKKDPSKLSEMIAIVRSCADKTNVINALCTIDYGIAGWNEIAKIAPTYLPAFIDMISPKQVDQVFTTLCQKNNEEGYCETGWQQIAKADKMLFIKFKNMATTETQKTILAEQEKYFEPLQKNNSIPSNSGFFSQSALPREKEREPMLAQTFSGGKV